MYIYIVNIIRKFTQKELPTPLGRWNLDYCNRKINNKIELSNEDHCGSCGQYAIIKNELNKNNVSTDVKNDVKNDVK